MKTITNAIWINPEQTAMRVDIDGVTHHGVTLESRFWKYIVDVEIADFVEPISSPTPSFRQDVIDALTGTPSEQAAAKSRLKKMKLDG